ncbi:hypothetical protein DNTS_008768 [Danionella cerebrum]|uniref:IRS-type PTB domain-containing protein n=1 Tax=Danionella cerebrum TaxID=2873325 RepID=A0A553NJ65_9TELE|nr:hypothetical protein DNTS_008768 [Danionella translucida]
MEEDIRKKGMLYFHQQRFGKKWRKVWCVLVAESKRSVSRLELYEYKQSSKKKASTKHKPDYKQVIRLRDCIRISDCDMSDCPKACATFLLETCDKVYVFAVLHPELKDWTQSLCEQAFPDLEAERRSQKSLYSEIASASSTRESDNSFYDTTDCVRDFQVISMSTDAAIRCELFGEYILTPLSDCLLLKDTKTKEEVYKWPYCYIRKFGQDMLSFSFEAGRRCESGEGNFEFATHQGERLFNVVSAAIQNLPKQSMAKPISFDQAEQSRVPENMDDDIIRSQESDFLIQNKKQAALQKSSEMLEPAPKSFSSISNQMMDTHSELETQEPVYATVSKAPQKSASSSNSHTHWQTLRNSVQQSAFLKDCFTPYISTDVPITQEEKVTAEDPTDLLGDFIKQLPINDAFQNTNVEAIYAYPQDAQDRGEWVVSALYEDPEEIMKANQSAHDGADELDFFSTHSTAAHSEPAQNSEEAFPIYDNFRLKPRQM